MKIEQVACPHCGHINNVNQPMTDWEIGMVVKNYEEAPKYSQPRRNECFGCHNIFWTVLRTLIPR